MATDDELVNIEYEAVWLPDEGCGGDEAAGRRALYEAGARYAAREIARDIRGLVDAMIAADDAYEAGLLAAMEIAEAKGQ